MLKLRFRQILVSGNRSDRLETNKKKDAELKLSTAAGLLLITLALPAPRLPAQTTNPPAASSDQIPLELILVSSAEEAQAIVDQLKKGEDFARIAKAKSIDPSADNGGFIGRQSPGALRVEMRDALKGLRPGQITPPIKTPTGYAILKVLFPDVGPDTATGTSAGGQNSMSFTSSRAMIRQAPNTAGVSDVEAAFVSMPKPPGWNRSVTTICQIHNGVVPRMTTYMNGLLSPDRADESTPEELENAQYVAALMESYQGHMAEAIAHWTEAYKIAKESIPERVPQMEEVLGDAYFHKAEMDNGVYRKPGERCLFPPRPGVAYPAFKKTDDLQEAMRYFTKYLDRKPDDLTVKWILNLAYMYLGQYPSGVPAKYLITEPAKEAPGESVGRFLDVAPEAGLDVYQLSGGVIVEDFQNNGLFDVVTSGYNVCDGLRYFHNNGDGTFSDRSKESGLAAIAAAGNIIQTDYNNDGCIDILALRGSWQMPMPLSLIRNNCDGTFTDVTTEAGLADHLFATQTAAWADIDNDGWLDVFIGDEQGPGQLFHNRGDGTFENISSTAGIDRTQFTKGVVAADYDNDGYPDFFVSNLRGNNFLYHNNHDGTFTNVAAQAGVQQSWFSFGTWFFDYDNDGWPDLFVANDEPSVEETMRTYLGLPHKFAPLKLFKNMRNGTFADVTTEVGLDKVFMPMGANYGDIDNDGYFDFYLGTGNPEYGTLVPNVLMRNKEGKSFVDVTVSSGTGELHKTHGIAFVDLENNGNEDIVVEMGGASPSDAHALRIFQNPGHPNNHWITIKLVGVKTNRAAVGARITVTTKDRDGKTHSFYRTVDSRGSWGASSFEQHIGIGPAAEISKIEIGWPTSRSKQEFANVAMDQYIQVKEFAQNYTAVKRKTYRIGGSSAQAPVAVAGANPSRNAGGSKP
jgi:tetratricopeptide (TPR) repeat protein